MKVDVRCEHCGNAQSVIIPWSNVPICRRCKRKIIRKEPHS